MSSAEKQHFPDKFRSPQRRDTRQRSGHSVSGEGTGSTCKIEETTLLEPVDGKVVLRVNLDRVTVPALFKRGLGVLGAGIYLRPKEKCRSVGKLAWKISGIVSQCDSKLEQVDGGYWHRNGIIVELPIEGKNCVVEQLSYTLLLETDKPVSVYGATIGALGYDYLVENDVYEAYSTKTSLYIPEILYLDPTEYAFSAEILKGKATGEGSPIVCKSCNRCSRYLPIDVENDRNTLSYSNHCVSRAPCTHAAFSRYRIVSGQSDEISKFIDDEYVTSNYGHQLECKPCKKFFVNLALNPLRNSTQHREDSLRRRAFEVLVSELLGKNWIYHEHRVQTGKEFDVHIWTTFGKECFNCEAPLPTPNAMDLDHTLPLSYLWPLDTTATCLCPTCNSSKHDRFPVEFYKEPQLVNLSKITGISLSVLKSRPINMDAVNRLVKRVVWFFDEFLGEYEYQKVREGKMAADLILHSLHNVFRASGVKIDLVQLYVETTGKAPETVTLR